MSHATRLIKEEIQNLRDMAAKNLRDSRDFRSVGMTHLAEWFSGRAGAYKLASESLKLTLDLIEIHE